MQLSEHFTLEELVLSQTAMRLNINNNPCEHEFNNLRLLAETLEDVRTVLNNRPILISSGFRSKTLNLAVHGASNSAHTKGLAVDFICPSFGEASKVARKIASSGIKFDQLIIEYGRWVHLGLAEIGAVNRMQLLSIYQPDHYIQGLV